ncbi:MAG: T9SS type A sorting domain-containing protein [bacterium]
MITTIHNYVPYYLKGSSNPLLKTLTTDNSSNGENSMLFYPELSNGKNTFSVVHNDENFSDTLVYDIIVSGELGVKELYNYPNPMKTETSFIFNLTGSDNPEKFKIKIYSVSGRLIKEIDTPVNIGYNQIAWDGKDSDGDFVANGTYFYKLILDDNSKTETQVQKLVVLK